MRLVLQLQTAWQMPMNRLIDTLHCEGCSCVVESRGEVLLLHKRGITDLYRLYTEQRETLADAAVADKVVGKAAAALMVLGGVKRVYADVISSAACELFESYGIAYTYARRVPHIINRTHSGLCPLERATAELNTLDDILSAIVAFVASLA